MEKGKSFGVMLDMSRNGVMNVASVKKYIDCLAKMGYNLIQLYTEDTYKVDNEPYFGYMRGSYTKEELKEIDGYALSKGVELVPCVQTLAHVNNIFKWSVYNQTHDLEDILLVEEERTYELLENIFKTVRECFSSKRINIGMDEAHKLGLGAYLDKHGYKNRFELLSKHLERVIKLAEKYDFKPMMWSDMFYRLANHGDYYAEKLNFSEEVINSVPKGVDLIYWDYYNTDKKMYDGMFKGHKQLAKEDIWFAGGAWSWIGFAPSNAHALVTTKVAMRSCRDNGIENVFITLWGDFGKECSYFALLPSLLYAIEVYNGNENLASIKRKFFELFGEKWDDFMALDTPNQVDGVTSEIVCPCKYMLYSDIFSGFLDATVSGSQNAYYTSAAKKLKNISKKSKFGYIFDYESKLCSCLAIKYDLGVRARDAYKKGDKEELSKISLDIKKLLPKLEAFYESFKNVWYVESKPQGFDIQEQRIGGLMLRLKACNERLIKFINGEIPEIPELNETLLDIETVGETLSKKPIAYVGWETAVTVNTI